MPEEQTDQNSTSLMVQQLSLQVAKLQMEFRYFRNIMVTLYLTIVAPLVVAIFINVLGGKK